MKYKRYGNTYAVRIDRGEEICEKLKEICVKENISFAAVSAIGALGEFTVGVFDTEKKEYKKKTFSGAYEIISLLGNITTMNGEPYSHLHLCAADETGICVGGHFNCGKVSATCEMFLQIVNGELSRFHEEQTGLNLFDIR
ncbi:MAG: DNA-binding protein [Clostridia bacterium]|nr:DNA-binding protein [Clostridia bacterium]